MDTPLTRYSLHGFANVEHSTDGGWVQFVEADAHLRSIKKRCEQLEVQTQHTNALHAEVERLQTFVDKHAAQELLDAYSGLHAAARLVHDGAKVCVKSGVIEMSTKAWIALSSAMDALEHKQ